MVHFWTCQEVLDQFLHPLKGQVDKFCIFWPILQNFGMFLGSRQTILMFKWPNLSIWSVLTTQNLDVEHWNISCVHPPRTWWFRSNPGNLWVFTIPISKGCQDITFFLSGQRHGVLGFLLFAIYSCRTIRNIKHKVSETGLSAMVTPQKREKHPKSRIFGKFRLFRSLVIPNTDIDVQIYVF